MKVGELLRDILVMAGDRNGQRVPQDTALSILNEEMEYVAIVFPAVVTHELLASADGYRVDISDSPPMMIKDVYVGEDLLERADRRLLEEAIRHVE
jgi:hypothetical protein